MIYDQDALWSELDKLPLEDVRKRLNQGIHAPAAKAKLVAIYIAQKDAEAERAARQIPEFAKLDAFGRMPVQYERIQQVRVMRSGELPFFPSAAARAAPGPLPYRRAQWRSQYRCTRAARSIRNNLQ